MAGIVVTELGSERKYRVPDSETFGGLDHSGVQKSIQAAQTASAAKNIVYGYPSNAKLNWDGTPFNLKGFVAPVMPLEVKTPDIRVKRQPLHVHDLYSHNFTYQPGFSRVNYF
jgi:hypothetical protein